MIVDRSQSAASEYFGVLRSRLLNARNKSDIRSVVITSPEKEDGKTFTSVNLAISLGQLRQLRILLIDGDLRRSGITNLFHLQGESGLSDFLEGWAPFEKCIKATVLPQLHIVPGGRISQESLPAILEGPRWPKFIQKAKEEFDLIIVDSVPVSAPVADFELLLNESVQKAPLGELVDIMDVGFACAYLATPLARRITGGTVYVDGGANIVS